MPPSALRIEPLSLASAAIVGFVVRSKKESSFRPRKRSKFGPATPGPKALAPEIEGRAFLEIVAVSVVHGRDASLDVIEYLRDHKSQHASADHQAGRGAT